MNPYQNLRQQLQCPMFVPFTVLGDPDKETSLQIIETLIENGADALELGLPFSDPPADGPVIQAADVRALDAGITVDDCFDILQQVRVKHDLPIGLLIYFNLVLQRGIEKFYQDCAAAGVTSVLIADLPLEHAEEIVPTAQAAGVQPVLLVSELTPDDRIADIAKLADGYIYIVSYLGVTGVQDAVMGEKVGETIARVRPHTDLPLIVGFGINTPEQVRAVAEAGADGIIVASRLVKEVPDVDVIGGVCNELSVVVRL